MQTTKPKNKNWIAIGSLALAGLCFVGCLGLGLLFMFSPQLYEAWLNSSSLQVGGPAPDFELTSLAGQSVRLSQYQGQPVLLTIGASWCPDCIREAPLLQKLHETHPELVILDVDVKELEPVVRNYVEENGLTYQVLLDFNGQINDKYQILAIPTELFIDKDGVIRAKIVEGVTPELLAANLPLIGIQP